MRILDFLIVATLFVPLFVGAEWSQSLQNQSALRYSRSQQIAISCFGFFSVVAVAIAAGLFGFYDYPGNLIPIFVFVLSFASWFFGTTLLGAFRRASK